MSVPGPVPVRAHLAGVAPYASARRLRPDLKDVAVRLDANENGLGPVIDAPGLHRYPDPAAGDLRSGLAGFAGVAPGRIWLGSGADDAIDVLLRTVVDPGQAVVIAVPTYEVYGQRARVHGATVREVPLMPDFDLDVDATVEAAADAPLVFVCSPNNPTGNLLGRERILSLLDRTEAVIAVDEAYVEYAMAGAEGPGASMAPIAGTPGRERLVVIRTLSKAWGLAGARTGYLVGAETLLRTMEVVGLPYRLTTSSVELGVRAVAAVDEMRRRCRATASERTRVAAALSDRGLRVLSSEANFLLFFVDDPAGVQRTLSDRHGVLLRRRDHLPGLGGALRVSLGTPDENDRFLAALEAILP